MEKTLVLYDVEGWRFFAVEGAKPDVFMPAPDQPDPASDYVQKPKPSVQLGTEAVAATHVAAHWGEIATVGAADERDSPLAEAIDQGSIAPLKHREAGRLAVDLGLVSFIVADPGFGGQVDPCTLPTDEERHLLDDEP
jgi:hypothetical protein